MLHKQSESTKQMATWYEKVVNNSSNITDKMNLTGKPSLTKQQSKYSRIIINKMQEVFSFLMKESYEESHELALELKNPALIFIIKQCYQYQLMKQIIQDKSKIIQVKFDMYLLNDSMADIRQLVELKEKDNQQKIKIQEITLLLESVKNGTYKDHYCTSYCKTIEIKQLHQKIMELNKVFKLKKIHCGEQRASGELIQQCKRVEKEKQELMRQIHEVVKRKNEIESELIKKQCQIDGLENKKQELQEKMKDSSETNTKSFQKIEQQKYLIEESNILNKYLIEELEAENKKLRALVEESEKEKEEFKWENQQNQLYNKELRKSHQLLQEKIQYFEEIYKKYEEVQMEIRNYQENLSRMQEYYENKIQQRSAEMQEEINALTNQLEMLENQRERYYEEYLALEEEFLQQRSHNQILKDKLKLYEQLISNELQNSKAALENQMTEAEDSAA